MKIRIIKIAECHQCPKVWQHFMLCSIKKKPCPPAGTPDWYPLEVFEEKGGGE